MNAISIIVPLAANETLWRQLLPQLLIGDADEILLAAPTPPPADFTPPTPSVRWLHCPQGGRGAQMNAAAATAKGDILWFVHADSRLTADTVERLRQSFSRAADALHYFDLRFYDGGLKMRINEFGVRLRCALFHNPFGDQALAMAAPTFAALGGFDENASYGEDHLLVLKARRQGRQIRRVGGVVGTSARRYTEQGWWRTLFLFQRLWLRQWRQQ